MRRTSKLLLAAILLVGLAFQGSVFAAQENGSKSSKKSRLSATERASRQMIRRYSFRGGTKFSPRGYGSTPTREATSKARSDYAPLHGGSYIP